TNDRHGYPHLVAMWYAMRDGDLLMTSYGKAQKIVNIERDSRATVLLESGTAYNQLRGVMLRGRATIVDDKELAIDVMQRIGAKMRGTPIADANRAALAKATSKRVVIRFHPERWSSWDHSKL